MGSAADVSNMTQDYNSLGGADMSPQAAFGFSLKRMLFDPTWQPPQQSAPATPPAPMPQQQPPAQLMRSGDQSRPPGMFGMGAPGGYTPQMSTLTGPNPLTLANSLLPKPNIQPGPIPGQPTTV